MTRLRLRQAALLTRPVTRSLQHLPLLACPALAFAAATLPQDPGLGARLAAVAVGLSTVFLLDDPAAATVAPSPRTLGFRRVHRLAIWLPVLAASYTEENGLSVGPGIAALNLAGQGIRLSARAYFGGTTQYFANFNWPWAYGDHGSLRVMAAHRQRSDTVRVFEETSDELTLQSGRYLGEHGRAALAISYFGMRSDMDGITLCQKLREGFQTAFIPIMMLTASADEANRTKAYMVGTDDYVTKPFTIPDLNARVMRLLRRTYGL